MKDIKVRRYIDGDETEICEVVKKDVLAENIKDYPKEAIEHLIESHNEDLIRRRAKAFHVYVLTENERIIGVGIIGPYWDSLTESSFFTIFIDPTYKGQGLGRKIIETLENNEYYKRVDRVEIPASITAVEFYKHFGYGFKKLGHIVDDEGIYRMEKYPKISENNVNPNQYNMRPYIDNEYHDYKEFVYKTKKDAYKKYVEELNMNPNLINRDLNVGFSGGEKKKNEILQLLVLNPKLAILDETDSGLDVDAIRTVSKGINLYKNEENAVLIITHNTRILQNLKVDYVHILVDGKIVKTGSSELAEEIEKEGYGKYKNEN